MLLLNTTDKHLVILIAILSGLNFLVPLKTSMQSQRACLMD